MKKRIYFSILLVLVLGAAAGPALASSGPDLTQADDLTPLSECIGACAASDSADAAAIAAYYQVLERDYVSVARGVYGAEEGKVAAAISAYYQVLERDYVSVARDASSAHMAAASMASPSQAAPSGTCPYPDPYDPASGCNPEQPAFALAPTYSGDDPYDPAADGHPETWAAAASGQLAAVVSSVGVGGIVEPLVALAPPSYRGGDLAGGIVEPVVASQPASYGGGDLAGADGHPETWAAAASGQLAAVVSSVGVGGILGPTLAPAPEGFSGDFAFDRTAGGAVASSGLGPERLLRVAAPSYSGDDPYDPAADGHPELGVAATSTELDAEACSYPDPYDPASSC